MSHFFSTRLEGIDHSDPAIQWRYGKGNVFPVAAEMQNALDNVNEILSSHHFPALPSVMLESQYSNGIISIQTPPFQYPGSFINEDNKLPFSEVSTDAVGRTIIKADALFTRCKNLPLLNKSGDAHAVVFESPAAVGIIVGSWRVISLHDKSIARKNILDRMLDLFLENGIAPHDIRVYVGPGLGPESYSVKKDVHDALAAANPLYLNALSLKTNPDTQEQIFSTSDGSIKWLLNFPKLIDIALKNRKDVMHDIQVDITQALNTFDKKTWKIAKQEAIDTANPAILKTAYAENTLFSARGYMRTVRQINRITQQHQLPLLEGLETGSSYNGTGRCLNGVMLE
jgi:hypothetical protein